MTWPPRCGMRLENAVLTVNCSRSQDFSNLPNWLLEITNEPVYSKTADKKGATIGNLICENIDLIQAVKQKKEQLEWQLSGMINIDVSFFENWGSTVNGLLLLAKPKTVAEVSKLVVAAKAVGLKV